MGNNFFLPVKKVFLVISTIAIVVLGFNSTAALAADRSADNSQARLERILKTKGKGWQIKSNGGLLYINPDDKRYWFALSGVMRLDQTQFIGRARDIQNDFPSGANMRKIEVDLTGGIGKYWNYTVGLDFTTGRRAALTDSWLSYEGIAENIEIFMGRHSCNWFGLENSTSTSWYPFLERSAMAGIFYPGDGLGLLVDYWLKNAGFTFMAVQPDQGTKIVTNVLRNGRRTANDRWMGLIRGTYAPCHEKGDVWHMGLSGVFRKNDANINPFPLSDFTMSTTPPARARFTVSAVNTGFINVSYASQANIELARQCGPWIIQGEYSYASFKRQNRPFNSLMRARGWNIQTQYMLTGEIHNYDVRDGNFGGIDVKNPYGAWEVAARYDHVNVNNRDLPAGKETDLTLGLNWYLNNNVRISGNYIYAVIHPTAMLPNLIRPNKRVLNIVAARVQIKFK